MSIKGLFRVATILVMGLGAGAFAQNPEDVFRINLNREVVVANKTLPPGVWEIRWSDSGPNPTIKFYRNNAVNVEVAAKSIASKNNEKHEATDAVIQKIGSEHYLTKIWIKGARTDYEILLPSQAASLAHGETQQVEAEFYSGSVFAQGALSEGQNRTHQAQGLGAVDAAVQQASKEAADQAERDRQEQRKKLATHLNTVFETKDTVRGLIVNIPNVLFDTGNYSLNPDAREKLTKLSGVVLAYPSLALSVEGHTDNVGSNIDNQRLSEDRAKAVRDFLVSQGIAAASITAHGFGESKPIATNDTEAGRQHNRRVELVVTGGAITGSK